VKPDEHADRAKRDWEEWYHAYAEPDSPLSRRLVVVRTRIGECLDAPTGSVPMRILSLCAGEGRDLLPELAARPALRTTTTLVELHPRLAATARQAASNLTGVEVRQGDAGDPATFEDVLPVDLLLLCGIFGNISTADIQVTVSAVPSMLTAGARVIWTRGRFDDEDLRPAIRRWFTEAGLDEVAFDGEPERFGVGVARAPAGLPDVPFSATRLFTFTP
jgi:SAM-dependent methyltransferase